MEVEESAELQGLGFDVLSSLTSQPLSALIDPSLNSSAGLPEALLPLQYISFSVVSVYLLFSSLVFLFLNSLFHFLGLIKS